MYGHLTITDGAEDNPDPITDLGPLEVLRYVAGRVSISGNSRLKYVDGTLDSLEFAGGGLSLSGNDSLLVFRGLQRANVPPERSVNTGLNPMLHTLDAFNGVDSLWRFSSYNNTAIKEVRILQNLRYVDWEIIFNRWDTDTVSFPELRRVRFFKPVGLYRLDYLDVPKLDTVVAIEFSYNHLSEFAGFQALKEVINFNILGNPGLHTIGGFDSLITISSSLRIEGCDRLENLDGFSALRYSGSLSNQYGSVNTGQIRLYENANLKSLHGLDSLQTPTKFSFSIIENDSLQDISALQGIERFHDIYVVRNKHLASLHGLHNARDTISANITVEQNYYSTAEQNYAGNVPASLDPADYTITGLREVIGFDSVRHIGGDCIIRGWDPLTHVDAFNNLETVGGDFRILAGNYLIDQNGVFRAGCKLRSVHGIFGISNHHGQEEIRFDSLREVRGILTLSGYPTVTTLEGLPNLKYLGDNTHQGYVSFGLMMSLENFGDLFSPELYAFSKGNVPSNGYISISRVPKLTSISGFCEYPTIRGKIRISRAPLLTDISNFYQIDSLLGKVQFSDVPLLEDCTPLCHLRTNGYWPGEVEYFGEVPQSCRDFEELTAVDCMPPVVAAPEAEPEPTVDVFPNPFGPQLHVRLDRPRRGSILLYDALGREVLSREVTGPSSRLTLAVADLPTGMYYLVFREAGSELTWTRPVWRW